MAKMTSVYRVSDIDLGKLDLGSVKAQDNGAKIVYLQHKSEPIFVQLPSMTCPYGLSSWPAEKGGGTEKVNLDLALVGYDSNPVIKEAFDKLTGVEKLVCERAMENSMSWFKRKVNTIDVIQAIFTPIVKFSKDKDTGEPNNKYPPVVRLNIPKKNGEVDVEVYNDKREKIAFESVDFKGAQVTAIAQIVSVWIIAGKFGITVKAKQLKVTPSKKITGYAFIVDDDEESVDE
jgi:hypothetical protein